MNKHLHRIIFNAARGQRMVVAETAISHGTAGAGGSDASAKTFTARLTKIGLAVGLACGLALALLAPFVVHAQIKADTTAPGTQRPVILQTGNGVPLVNIATPSAAGVSRNVFSQFDVRPNGVILNNVRSNAAKTTIGGYVQANPFLASGAARVILNEVNSSNPTYLNGPTEVAGSRAEVVIANPSGIRVNGGTFLNASGVTLTTGTPVLSGGNLDAFLVRRGTVDISGLGLDASTADYTRILARAMEVNAGLWAQHLTVVTGTNEVKALASGADATTTQIVGTGAAPNFMLDVGAIGGMYAGHIYLVGTEAGLGVNNRGAVSAQQGKMVLLANGQLVNQGTIQAKGDVTVSAAGAIDNSGASAVISSQGHLDVTSGSTVSNTGGATVAATGSLSVAAAGSLSNVGTITPANTVVASTIAAHGAVRITETFGREASKFVGDYAEIQTRQAIALREQARTETDPDKRDALNAQADQLQAEWGDNGWKRIAAHTVIGGLTGALSVGLADFRKARRQAFEPEGREADSRQLRVGRRPAGAGA